MTSPRISLAEAANNLYEAIYRSSGGYTIQVDGEGRLDLVDITTGDREPVAWVNKKAEKK